MLPTQTLYTINYILNEFIFDFITKIINNLFLFCDVFYVCLNLCYIITKDQRQHLNVVATKNVSNDVPTTNVSSQSTNNDGDVHVNYSTQNAPLLHSSPATALSPTTLLPPPHLAKNNITSSPMLFGQSPTPSVTISKFLKYNQTVPHGYLIYGPHCKIPDLDPLGKDVMKLFHQETFQ